MINVYKPISITPYQLIAPLKKKLPGLSSERIAYAGRLDPMAHGVMLFLVGQETKLQPSYQNMKKVYETKVVFGISTDTYDIMGELKSTKSPEKIEKIKTISSNYVKTLKGKFFQNYPPFSSYHLEGEPLYKLYREGRLNTKNLPQKKVCVYSSQIGNFRFTEFQSLRPDWIKKIQNTKGDFRQENIIGQYRSLSNIKLIIADAKFEVSGGTYIRSIVNDIGERTGAGAVALDIFRKSIGDTYYVEDSIKVLGNLGKIS